MINTQNISLMGMISQVKGNIVSDMAGEKVMLSIKNGKYYNLGEIGGEIWSILEEPITVSQLIASLMATYEVEQADCEEEVISFLELLLQEGLIEIE
jgi:hypothetical protein